MTTGRINQVATVEIEESRRKSPQENSQKRIQIVREDEFLFDSGHFPAERAGNSSPRAKRARSEAPKRLEPVLLCPKFGSLSRPFTAAALFR
jgi:hypothetical protein